VLVDCGIRKIDLSGRLSRTGEKIENILAILLSHGHADHTSGLLSVAKAIEPHIYMTAGTLQEIYLHDYTPKMTIFRPGDFIRIAQPDDVIAGLEIETFPVPHDAAEPVGFIFQANGAKAGIVVDSGSITELMAEKLMGCQVIIMESNYDCRMLAAGGHPVALKRRVMGELGHLSNQAVAEWVETGMDAKVETLVLCHLSRDNNNPEVVKSVVGAAIRSRGLETQLHVVGFGCSSPAFYTEGGTDKAVVWPPESAVIW
jgi:phosphoribosyl 1,2-cyclic phosphodiesterase